MSYEGPPPNLASDRAIQLITEARQHDDFLYRTLFGNKSLPHVVYQIEHFKILFDIVPAIRRNTLMKFSQLHRNTLISTTSINGQTINMLTETRIKHTTEAKTAKKGFSMPGGGGGGQGGGGGGMF